MSLGDKARLGEPKETGIWIRSTARQGKEGVLAGYDVVIDIGGDRSIALSEDEAFKHARILLRACAMAEYDHSVYQQMLARMDDPDIAYSVVQDLQRDRAPFNPDFESTKPFTYLPGLARDDARTPLIQLRVDDKPVGLWDLNEARKHAFVLIEAPQAAELDEVYLKVLRGVIGLEEDLARRVVGGLAEHRPEYENPADAEG